MTGFEHFIGDYYNSTGVNKPHDVVKHFTASLFHSYFIHSLPGWWPQRNHPNDLWSSPLRLRGKKQISQAIFACWLCIENTLLCIHGEKMLRCFHFLHALWFYSQQKHSVKCFSFHLSILMYLSPFLNAIFTFTIWVDLIYSFN